MGGCVSVHIGVGVGGMNTHLCPMCVLFLPSIDISLYIAISNKFESNEGLLIAIVIGAGYPL